MTELSLSDKKALRWEINKIKDLLENNNGIHREFNILRRVLAEAEQAKTVWGILNNGHNEYRIVNETETNLENLRGSIAIPTKGDVDMAKDRRQVMIGKNDDGTPVYKDIKGISQEEVNIKIVKAFVESGRIWEVMEKPKTQSEIVNITLKEYSKQWIQRKRKLKQTTKANYEKYLNSYIIPCLGDKLIGEIDVDDVQAMLDKYSYLSEKTLKDAKTLLSQIMDYAIDDEIIKKNPCKKKDIEIPSNKKTVRQALSIDKYRDIINHLDILTDNDRRYIALIMFTAMRRGEVLGLRWEDVDILNNLIHIRRNVTHPQQNTPVITTPKTKAGIRDIPIDKTLLDILIPNKKTGYIIGDREEPITLSAYRNMWERITATIDMHGATPHILRHSYLTYAVGETTDYKTVQGISGHADIGTLLNRYAHPQEHKVKELADDMHKMITEVG